MRGINIHRVVNVSNTIETKIFDKAFVGAKVWGVVKQRVIRARSCAS
jgi:hypothetical protein